jgi:hypothetical protein
MKVKKHNSLARLLVVFVLLGGAVLAAAQNKKDIYQAAETAASEGKTEESQKLYCQVAKLDPGFKDAKMLCVVMTEEVGRERKKNEERFNTGMKQFNEGKYDEAQHEFANIKWGQHYEEAREYLTVKIPRARQGKENTEKKRS